MVRGMDLAPVSQPLGPSWRIFGLPAVTPSLYTEMLVWLGAETFQDGCSKGLVYFLYGVNLSHFQTVKHEYCLPV